MGNQIFHRFIDEVEVKRCGKCFGWLPLNSFDRSKQTPLSLSARAGRTPLETCASRTQNATKERAPDCLQRKKLNFGLLKWTARMALPEEIKKCSNMELKLN